MNLSVKFIAYSLAIFFCLNNPVFADPNDTLIASYTRAYEKLWYLIKDNGSFKNSVFIVESVFRRDSSVYNDYQARINGLVSIVKTVYKNSTASNTYKQDEFNYLINYSIFSSLADSITFTEKGVKYVHLPFKYNFQDVSANKSLNNSLVITLLKTYQGNCHNLAYLYKIIADEIGAKCWLALAPNHIYIRNYQSKIGWYNTELTSECFPTDAWLMASGYISPDAVRSGIYMDTLSNQQSIALCVLDLAKGYEFQSQNYYDGFIIKCCDLVLKYHSVNPMALLLKAETLQKVYLKQKADNSPEASVTYKEMETYYIKLAKLHYREMPEKMYSQWLKSIIPQKEKYTNQKLRFITK